MKSEECFRASDVCGCIFKTKVQGFRERERERKRVVKQIGGRIVKEEEYARPLVNSYWDMCVVSV